MNILNINTQDVFGGAAHAAYGIHTRLNENGHHSRMLVGKKDSRDDNIRETTVGPNGRRNLFSTFLDRSAGFFSGMSYHLFGCPDMESAPHPSSMAILRDPWLRNADIVNLHNIHGGYFDLFLLPEICSAKATVWTLHDMWAVTGHCAHSYDCDRWKVECGNCPHPGTYPPVRKDNTRVVLKRKKDVYSRSDMVLVAPSRWLKDIVARSILSNKKCELIYNGVDHRFFMNHEKGPSRELLRLPSGKKILFFAAHDGLANGFKGGNYVKEALDRLPGRREILVLVGGDSRSFSETFNGTEIRHLGQLSKELLPYYYSASDLFLLPSIADNCPLVALEAMACGTPVIAFRTGGIPELVSHNSTGYIAGHGDVEEFAEGIELFLSDEGRLDKAGKISRMSVEEKFTLDIQVRKYLELFKYVLDHT